MNKMTRLPAPRDFLGVVEQNQRVIVAGAHAMWQLRDAIQELTSSTGLEVVYDPASDPDALDMLVHVGGGAAEGAMFGATVGGVLGSIFKSPGLGLLLGGLIGAAAGAERGSRRISYGWRVRAYMDRYVGEPVAYIDLVRESS